MFPAVTWLRDGRSRIAGSNHFKTKVFISSPKYPDWIWSPKYLQIKFSRRRKSTDMWRWTLSSSSIKDKNTDSIVCLFWTAEEQCVFTTDVCLDSYNSMSCLGFAIFHSLVTPEKMFVFGWKDCNKYRPYNPIYFWIRVIDLSHLNKFLDPPIRKLLRTSSRDDSSLLVTTALAPSSLAAITVTYEYHKCLPVWWLYLLWYLSSWTWFRNLLWIFLDIRICSV